VRATGPRGAAGDTSVTSLTPLGPAPTLAAQQPPSRGPPSDGAAPADSAEQAPAVGWPDEGIPPAAGTPPPATPCSTASPPAGLSALAAAARCVAAGGGRLREPGPPIHAGCPLPQRRRASQVSVGRLV
jgi:hypothetical protein